jgi:hypothetical protein
MTDTDLEALTMKLRTATPMGRLSHAEALTVVKYLLTVFAPPAPAPLAPPPIAS